MEFRDEPITLLDISFLLSIRQNRVTVSRDNSPKKVVNQSFIVYYENLKRQDFK